MTEESPETTKLTTRFCNRSRMQAHGTTLDMGTELHNWPNGRFVQIQDGFRSKETLVAIKGIPISLKQPWQWTVYMASTP